MNTIVEFLVLAIAFILLVFFVRWFTGSLRQEPFDEELQQSGAKLRRMVGYSYVIAFGTLMYTVYPFFNNFTGDPALQEGAFIMVRGCVEPSENQPIAPVQSCREGRYQWLLSIGAAMTPNDTPELVGQGGNFTLYGGLTVPLYVVVIALLGGAVSMTRRVPEIQRLSWAYLIMEDQQRHPDRYCTHLLMEDVLNKEKNERPMPPESAREHFIFQIMQLISAPVIAVVAFEIFAPSSVAIAIAIAFISGFTSEHVLMAIRNVAGKFIAKEDKSPLGNTPAEPPVSEAGNTQAVASADKAAVEKKTTPASRSNPTNPIAKQAANTPTNPPAKPEK